MKFVNFGQDPGAGLLHKLCIPIQKVAPAFVEEVRREFAAMLLKLVDRGLARFFTRLHAAFAQHLAALAQIALLAGRDDIFP